MRIEIIMGSPRKQGNTAALLGPMTDELEKLSAHTTTTWLYDKNILPCLACRSCQKDWTIFGCIRKDDVQALFHSLLQADMLILATPIYSWYCTPPMKALLDRLVYGMNKYYGDTKGPSLWAGKQLALLTTCGYPPENGVDLWEEGIRRYCRHSQLRYLGAHAERHRGYAVPFMDADKEQRVRLFARQLIQQSAGQ